MRPKSSAQHHFPAALIFQVTKGLKKSAISGFALPRTFFRHSRHIFPNRGSRRNSRSDNSIISNECQTDQSTQFCYFKLKSTYFAQFYIFLVLLFLFSIQASKIYGPFFYYMHKIIFCALAQPKTESHKSYSSVPDNRTKQYAYLFFLDFS